MKCFTIFLFLFLSLSFTYAQSQLWGTTANGGANGNGTIFHTNGNGDSLSVAYAFPNAYPGSSPYFTQLVQTSNGLLYGVTYQGGAHTMGVLFSLDTLTNSYINLFDFDSTAGANPEGSLMQANNDLLYGMTSQGGANNQGTLFSFNTLTKIYTKLFDFTTANGANPSGSLIQAKNGKLYGMTSTGGTDTHGVLFSFDITTNLYTKLFDFNKATDGASPNGSLIQAKNGKLYGMTPHGGGSNDDGILFSFDLSNNTLTQIIIFNQAVSGSHPLGSLMQAADGRFYGMTSFGGSAGNGVLFSLDSTSGSYIKLYEFSLVTDGTAPQGTALVQSANGLLYGMTFSGGNANNGVIFSYDPSAKKYSRLIDFTGANGTNPKGSLTYAANHKLYGMTIAGGATGNGVLFSFKPTTNNFTKLIDFSSNAFGSHPNGSIVRANDGLLYGMTQSGGANTMGVIFSFNPPSNTYTKILSFNDSVTGSKPFGSMIQANDGKLYGMTNSGGKNNNGVLFTFYFFNDTYTNLFNFNSAISGAAPKGSLIQAGNGLLYGMTSKGGTADGGVIFSFDISNQTFKKLFDFSGAKGLGPSGSLMQASDSLLYGMTSGGGSNGSGVLFSFNVTSNTYTKLLDFKGTTYGSFPSGSLMQGSNGLLYGMTSSGGSNGAGTFFSFNPIGNIFTKILDFDNANNGGDPIGSLFQACNKKLYGTTAQGGSMGEGILFEYDAATSVFNPKQNFIGLNGANSSYGALIETLSPAVAPAITISANTGTKICVGTNVNITAAIVNGSTTTSYQWKLNGNNVGSNSGSYSNNSLNNGDIIVCQLTTSNTPCPGPSVVYSNALAFSVSQTVLPRINIIADHDSICQGDSVIFKARVINGGSAPVYQWKLNGVNVGKNDSSYTNNTLNNADKITCQLISNALCANPSSINSTAVVMDVSSSVTPLLSVLAKPGTTICKGSSVTFKAILTNGGNTPIYQWSLNGQKVGTNSNIYSSSTLLNGDAVSCQLTSNAKCATNRKISAYVGIKTECCIDGSNYFDLYPNPTRGIFSICYSPVMESLIKQKESIVNIYDLSGNLLSADFKYSRNVGESIIDMSDLAAGTYIIEVIIVTENQSFSKKIVKCKM